MTGEITRAKNIIESVRMFYKAREKVTKIFVDYCTKEPETKYKATH